MSSQQIDASRDEEGAWYGRFFWMDRWIECDEGFATKDEALKDAQDQLDYLQSH